MTDRVNAFVVVLEQNIRTDEAEPILNAIRLIRGVLSVDPQIVTSNDWVAEQRAKRELMEKLWDLAE